MSVLRACTATSKKNEDFNVRNLFWCLYTQIRGKSKGNGAGKQNKIQIKIN